MIFIELGHCNHLAMTWIAQRLERVHGKHEVVDSSSARANFLYGIEKP